MLPRHSPLLRLLLATAFAVAGSAAARAQSTLPTSGHVVAGSASIGAPSGNTLSITQTSPKAIVNWNTFSVGQPNAVDFNQPSSSAAILNKVTGTTPSTIAGQINANGQVYLVNPNGVAITPSGSVQVGGGFVASTLGISNQNFMSGKLSFTGNGASAGVSNAGSITAAPGGYVGLIGGTAANSGTISVPLGKVALGSGEAATLDLNGGGFLQVAVPTGAKTAQGQALVSNSGKINAAGGTVELRAATVANAIRDAVNMSGTIAATGVSGHDGAITLSGGPGGAVNVSGTLDASAPVIANQPRANGGSIAASGARVRIGHHAVLNASGTKGGSVLVGVTAPGGVGEAQKTTIASGAQILAAGDPTVAGSGGYIETSGGKLSFGGATINAGNGGTWLGDPTDLTIDTAAATTINNALNNNNNVIEETTATTASGAGNTSSGPGDIIVNAALGWNTSATLTLSAFNGITVNAPITIGGAGSLVLTTNNNIGGASSGSGGLTFTLGEGSAQFASEASNPGLIINFDLYTLIYTPAELENFATTVSGGTVGGFHAIATNIDASSVNPFPIIGNDANFFNGTLDGLGHTVSNVTINSSNQLVGFFSQINGAAVVRNLALGVNVTSTNANGDATGGAVGFNSGGTISNVSTSGSVSYTISSAPSNLTVGGLVGTNNGSILLSSSTAQVSGTGSAFAYVGGLVGVNDGSIGQSFATGAVIDSASAGNVGGLVGWNEAGGSITNAYALGTVNALSKNLNIGGLIGENGPAAGTVSQVFSTGSLFITNPDTAGGLIGANGGTVTDGYWDKTTNGLSNAVGSGSSAGISALTTAELAGQGIPPGLPAGFSSSTWGNLNNQVTPYLINNPGPVFLGTDSSANPLLYNLIFTPTQLQNINNAQSSNFLLAQNLDLSTFGDFTPIGTFSGTFNGLGNTIANLTIFDLVDPAAGLFGTIASRGTVSNLILSGGSVTAPGNVGALAGVNNGTISNVQSSVPVTGFGQAGGLVGDMLGGSITNSSSSGAVTGELIPGSSSSGTPVSIGGLVGQLDAGSVTGSSATGAVTAADGSQIGGLIGQTAPGTFVTSSFATGSVTAIPQTNGGVTVGGLIGLNDATVTQSYATGAVTGEQDVGGLIGLNDTSGVVANSFASGSVTAVVDTLHSFPGFDVGGLIGGDDGGAATTNVFATGNVTGGDNIGGLIGVLSNGLTNAYSTGAVSVASGGSGTNIHGLIGINNFAPVTNAYYDACTALADCAAGSTSLGLQADGSIGKTTAELQTDLTSLNFPGAPVWGIVPGVSYPYLCWQFGGCGGATPQVVSGTVFQDQGSTPAGAGITVAGLTNGLQFNSVLTGGTVATGANGYYYYLLAPNTIPANGGVLTYTTGVGTVGGAAFTDGVSGGVATGLNIFADTLHEITADTQNSVLQGNLAAAAGSDPTAVPLLASLPNLQIDASGVAFDVDTPISYPSGTVTLNANALTESTATITASSLVANSVNSVDLSGNNAVGALTATVTGSGASFDFVNIPSLAVGSLGSPAGITTNNGAVVLESTTGDIDLFTSINTVSGGGDPSVGSAGVALLAPNGVLEEFGGSIVAPAVVASAANGIDFASFAGPNAFLTFAGQVTASGQQLSVVTGTSLTIDNVSVAAGPLSLSLSGLTTNSGDLNLGVSGALALHQPVNTNNGSTTLGSSPGFVSLGAFGDIIESTNSGNNGVIVAGSLFAESFKGNVELTAPNRLGANDNGSGIAQTAGLLAGSAEGNFEFIDHNAPLTIDTLSCGCLGIFTSFGSVDLATTGAGAIVINQPVNSGGEINIAVAPGYGFTNNIGNNTVFGFPSAGLDTSAFGGAPIIILADGMNLSGGTINAGFGPILLGPASLNTNVSLGAPSTINLDGTTSGPLGLAQGDIDSITAAFLQVGYRNVDGSVSFNGTIDVASNIQVNTNNINDGFGNSTLLLVTGGAVTESGGALSATGPNTLSLGVLAGSAAMNQNNAVGTLAAYTDGANANFSFVNSGQALAVDALFDPQAGLRIDRNGFPTAFDMLGAAPNPLAGIITANGNVSITVENSGALTLNQPINAGTGSVTAASAGDLTIGASGSVTGNTITLATLGNFTNNAGAGALTAGPIGQWLIYSTNPLNDNDGGLTPNFIQYAATYPVGTAGNPTPPDVPGNGFLYSFAPTVTVDSVTKIYDGTINLPTDVAAYTLGSGGFNGDSVSLVASGATGVYASPNVGSGIGVTLTGLSINATNTSGIAVYGYGVVAANSGAIGTITPKTLTASLTGTIGKVYDGTTSALLVSGNFLLSGFVAGQGAIVSPLFGTYNSADVTTANTVTAHLLAADFIANAGTLLSNYTLPTIAAGAGSITPATLTASIIGNPTKAYDGTTIAALTPGNFSLSGFITGQGAIVSPLFGTYNSADVTTANTVTAHLLAADFIANPGTLFSNYTLPTIASGAGAITPATLTASIIGNPTKVYDGTTIAALTPGNFSLSGFITGQGAIVSPLFGTYNSPNVGTATTVTANLLAADFIANPGTLLSNYTLPAIATGAGAITPATLTPSGGTSPLLYAKPFIGPDGFAGGTNGLNPNLTNCSASSIAGLLKGTGKATLYGGGACGSL